MPGQEFIVYHPDFTGDTPFYLDDGRTKRQLGRYPRLRSGRITVFDAQPEISFCQITESANQKQFPIGSSLEAVSLGSISHLVAGSRFAYGLEDSNLTPPEQLTSAVDRILKDGNEPYAICFNLDNVSELQEQRGTAAVNQSLLHLYSAINSTFRDAMAIGQPEATQLVVITVTSNDLDEKTVKNIIRIVDEKTDGIAKIRAGVFDPAWGIKNKVKHDNSELLHKYAIEFARYALAIPSIEDGDDVVVFNPVIAFNILVSADSRGKYENAISDYKKFLEMGVRYAYLDNYAGLIANKYTDDLDFEIECYSRAIKLYPEFGSFISNLAISLSDKGRYLEAHNKFVKIPSIDKNWDPSNYELSEKAYTAYQVHKLELAQIPKEQVRQALAESIESSKKSNEEINPKIARALNSFDTAD